MSIFVVAAQQKRLVANLLQDLSIAHKNAKGEESG